MKWKYSSVVEKKNLELETNAKGILKCLILIKITQPRLLFMLASRAKVGLRANERIM